MKNILVTGAAGFIGFHLINRLIKEKYQIIGLDNINDYYDVSLKFARLKEAGIEKEKIKYNLIINSKKNQNYRFIKLDLLDKDNLKYLFHKYKFDYIIHLAAQAGVRYSLTNPDLYIKSNIIGFYNILESCREVPPEHLLFASSSSVYGLSDKMPLSTKDNVGHPISLYAATKRGNELFAHVYSHLFDIPVTGLRFFTVYGPWRRPDMAYFSFTKKILNDEPIEVFNNGNFERDFTYIDDIIEGVINLIGLLPEKETGIESLDSSQIAKFKIYNLGNSSPVKLMDFINTLENVIGKNAKIKYKGMQPDDVLKTYADISELENVIGFNPKIELSQGLTRFYDWFTNFYNIKK